MCKCTPRYVWIGTSYKSELTMMNTAAFLPMIRHLNKCWWRVCWKPWSRGAERLAMTWGCQEDMRDIIKTEVNRLDSTWGLALTSSPPCLNGSLPHPDTYVHAEFWTCARCTSPPSRTWVPREQGECDILTTTTVPDFSTYQILKKKDCWINKGVKMNCSIRWGELV